MGLRLVAVVVMHVFGEATERDRDKAKDRSHRSKDRVKDSGMFTTNFVHEPDAIVNTFFKVGSLILYCGLIFSNCSLII